ncbi:hypothetical protein B7G68_02750 [Caulobacter segnis]|uniref:Transmembrane protein n=2 Tax=Caulobacter segnis TaxID=88688 RepID=D5VHR6_CAUST|nr:hypothetical protein [Caulobacter segnis]ADG09047.1 conserved hypothetical protein [Caulobacter segnis ATCC 21756]AVQ00874.1 hypothetical protein B7G68_02750 [Caulobacter segnis]
MFAAVPLLALPVLVYNLIVLLLPGGFKAADATLRLAEPLFTIRMTSGAGWAVSLSDLLLAGALVVLFVELLKSTNSKRLAIVNHSLSMVLFIVCLVEFLLLPAFATSTFFLLALMVLLDVLAGFIVTIVAARRDVDFGE